MKITIFAFATHGLSHEILIIIFSTCCSIVDIVVTAISISVFSFLIRTIACRGVLIYFIKTKDKEGWINRKILNIIMYNIDNITLLEIVLPLNIQVFHELSECSILFRPNSA